MVAANSGCHRGGGLQISPRHALPCTMVCHMSSYIAVGCKPDLTMRWLAPPAVAAVAADGAKAVVGVGDGADAVGDADNGMLVQRKLLLIQRAARHFALLHQLRGAVDHVFQTLYFGRRVGDVQPLRVRHRYPWFVPAQSFQAAQPARQGLKRMSTGPGSRFKTQARVQRVSHHRLPAIWAMSNCRRMMP